MAALLRAFLPGCEKAARTILFFTDRSIIIIWNHDIVSNSTTKIVHFDMTFVINLRTAFDSGRSFFTENNRKICIRSKSDRRHLISVLYVIRRA